jgi:hypothetical protein
MRRVTRMFLDFLMAIEPNENQVQTDSQVSLTVVYAIFLPGLGIFEKKVTNRLN